MEIIYKKPSELTPYKNNPRDNDGAVDYIMRSIDSFGFKVPIVIDGAWLVSRAFLLPFILRIF